MSREELTRDKELLKALKSLPISRINLVDKELGQASPMVDVFGLVNNLPLDILVHNLTLAGYSDDSIMDILIKLKVSCEPEISIQR
jgi:hypothetical protein